MNRRVIAWHVAKQTKQGGFAFVVTAEFVGLHLFGMPVGKGMMPVVKVRAVPLYAVIIEPGGAEFGLETFTEAAFGLRIYMDAFCDVRVHVNSWSVLMFLMFGRLKAFSFGNGAGRDGGRLAAALGRAGWNLKLFPTFSQFGFVARFSLRR